MLTALAGALGFLSRLPVGRTNRAWHAFVATPVTFPLVGYIVGALAVVPYGAGRVLGLPSPILALVYVVVMYSLTGITHIDGLADVGDAVAVHGDEPDPRSVMADSAVGAGGVLAVTGSMAGLVLGVVALGSLPLRIAVGLLIAAEVGTKLGMAALACVGRPGPAGLGAAVTTHAERGQLLGPVVLAVPAAFLTWPSPVGAIAVTAGLLIGLGALTWAERTLGGVTGDVFGASNEVGRVAALHLGVIGWTLW